MRYCPIVATVSTAALRGRQRLAWLSLLVMVALIGCTWGEPPPAPAKSQAQAPDAPGPTESERPPIKPVRASAPPEGRLPRFVNITPKSGISFERFDDIRGLRRIHESTGGGVGLLDYDGDGLLDILLTDGCRLPLKERDNSHYSRLYRNLGRGRFTEVTRPSFFDCVGYGQGVAVGDFNRDGFEDFYIAAFGHNSLWQNNGDGTFTEVTKQTGVDDSRWSTSAAFADFDCNGDLDLYVVNYVDAADDPPKLCPNEQSPDGYVQCPPTIFSAVDDVLFISDGSGQFRDESQQVGIVGDDGKGLSAVVFDADGDRRPDVFVANDGTPNFFYKNVSELGQNAVGSRNGIGFEEQAALSGVALNSQGVAQACMGIACGDYDQDGLSDLFVTNFFADTNVLYRNLGGSSFEDATNRSGLGPPSRPMLGFGTEFIDFDNDAWLDLVVANGHIDDLTWANPEESYRMPAQMFRNERDGSFKDVSAWSGDYFQRKLLGRGLAVGDLDNDGDQDFVVSNQLGPTAVVSNEMPDGGKSVVIRLIGRESNRSAINARVVARWPDRQVVREVVGGGSFQASSDRRIHIGLNASELVPELEIHWPSGNRDTWKDIAHGNYTAVEGSPLIKAVVQQ